MRSLTYLNGESRLPSDIKNLVLPYYSIRVVEHRLTTQGDKGYKSSIMAVRGYLTHNQLSIFTTFIIQL